MKISMKTNRICNEGENNEDNSNEGYNDEDQYEANELENPWKQAQKKLQKSKTHHFWNENWQKKRKKTKLKVRKREKSETEEEEFTTLQVINKLASVEENKGKCDILRPSTST